MAQSNEILTGVAKTIGGALGAVVGSAEAMKERITSAVDQAPSLNEVKRKVRREAKAASSRAKRAANAAGREMRRPAARRAATKRRPRRVRAALGRPARRPKRGIKMRSRKSTSARRRK